MLRRLAEHLATPPLVFPILCTCAKSYQMRRSATASYAMLMSSINKGETAVHGRHYPGGWLCACLTFW